MKANTFCPVSEGPNQVPEKIMRMRPVARQLKFEIQGAMIFREGLNGDSFCLRWPEPQFLKGRLRLKLGNREVSAAVTSGRFSEMLTQLFWRNPDDAKIIVQTG